MDVYTFVARKSFAATSRFNLTIRFSMSVILQRLAFVVWLKEPCSIYCNALMEGLTNKAPRQGQKSKHEINLEP